ncbi:MAG: right-handed parallel beta-helix repeat-containing protein [Candidatus Cloacimonetes bacterium]|nr:right-handed parallel beta-helix repeat-containing protein [Candidatus Cloacimonadota bacterium]MCF7814242.1 right-handed parallel beta-helix repeat-containing protein [Candidatus Cloacimonadota bacterium]MCF7868449.1 right-handed parallel beta-helix repeat-containing protein [Candidatus Cloacimonadota bacterium]MCF7883931.1 right-handed parallel beta-helix repeat-containing protein [Candidatus Cloacimonadota bacterium]
MVITKIKYLVLFLFAFFVFSFLHSLIINIPDDQPTIQAGVNIAELGDTILVAPGIYYENIYLHQRRDISLIGSGTDNTTIDGGENGHVVAFSFSSGKICNFTITNSGDDPGYSSGIFTSCSRIVIEDNTITNNCRGIAVSSNSNVIINRNEITNNSGFSTVHFSVSVGIVSYNLIADNDCNGIYPYYSEPDIINNTITGNGEFVAILLNPTEGQIVRNNIITGFSYGIILEGGLESAIHLVDIAYNDVWNNSTANYWEYYGVLPNYYSQPFSPQPGYGEINLDPLFVDPFYGDYHLQSDSPCVDAGDPNLPLDPDGTIADIGALYYHQANGIEEHEIPHNSSLTSHLSNYPNPFNPSTTISFNITQTSSFATIEIYNLKGQKIKTFSHAELVEAYGKPASYSVVWNGTDQNNKPVSSGIYYAKLKSGNVEANCKMLLLK